MLTGISPKITRQHILFQFINCTFWIIMGKCVCSISSFLTAMEQCADTAHHSGTNFISETRPAKSIVVVLYISNTDLSVAVNIGSKSLEYQSRDLTFVPAKSDWQKMNEYMILSFIVCKCTVHCNDDNRWRFQL